MLDDSKLCRTEAQPEEHEGGGDFEGVAVVLFGPSKLPELGKNLGKTVRSLQDAAQVRFN